MTIFKSGERVMILADDREVEGVVVIASPNGISLMLGFDAMIGGHVRTMPVMHQEADWYASIMDGQQVRLQRKH